MKKSKEHMKIVATQCLIKNGIRWKELNNGYHFKIGHINFYPTTGLWQSDNIGGDKGRGIDSLIRLLKKNNPIIKYKDNINQLSVEQLFQIASHSKLKSLMGICEAIHKEIYG